MCPNECIKISFFSPSAAVCHSGSPVLWFHDVLGRHMRLQRLSKSRLRPRNAVVTSRYCMFIVTSLRGVLVLYYPRLRVPLAGIFPDSPWTIVLFEPMPALEVGTEQADIKYLRKPERKYNIIRHWRVDEGLKSGSQQKPWTMDPEDCKRKL
jgi:hypothetical protein